MRSSLVKGDICCIVGLVAHLGRPYWKVQIVYIHDTYTALHYTATLHCTALDCTVLDCTALHCTSSQRITPHRTAPHHNTLQHIAIHNIINCSAQSHTSTATLPPQSRPAASISLYIYTKSYTDSLAFLLYPVLSLHYKGSREKGRVRKIGLLAL
jgi:hypothetical protein